MTDVMWVLVIVMSVVVVAVFYRLADLTESTLRHAERLSHLEAGRGTLTALCCDLERQVHVLSHRVDHLHYALALFDEPDDEPFTPDTDMED